MADNGKMISVSLDQILQPGDFECVCVQPSANVLHEDTVQHDFPSLFDEHGDSIMMSVEGVEVSEAVDLPLDLGRANDETGTAFVKPHEAPVETAEFDFTMWQDPLSKLSRQSLPACLVSSGAHHWCFQGSSSTDHFRGFA